MLASAKKKIVRAHVMISEKTRREIRSLSVVNNCSIKELFQSAITNFISNGININSDISSYSSTNPEIRHATHIYNDLHTQMKLIAINRYNNCSIAMLYGYILSSYVREKLSEKTKS